LFVVWSWLVLDVGLVVLCVVPNWFFLVTGGSEFVIVMFVLSIGHVVIIRELSL
jgi:hypothetical protein